MKKIALAILIFASCSKDEDIKQTEIKVVESFSNVPVSGAELVFIRCNYGCPLGGTLLFEGSTDDKGIVKVPTNFYNDASLIMNVVKPNYWQFEVQRSPVVSIAPHGWVKLRIHMVGTYPAGSKLLVEIRNQAANWSDLTEYNAATDSLISIKGFGSQTNSIKWQVVDAGFNLFNNGTLDGLNIPRFDTLTNVTLDY